MTEHNHGAAISGRESEKHFKNTLIDSAGVTFLKTVKEFQNYYGTEKGRRMYEETIKRPYPTDWGLLSSSKTKAGNVRNFIADGYIPELNLILELKFSKAHGTTEEKVMYDLVKISKGVYQNSIGSRLLYIFHGPVCDKVAVYEQFEYEVSKQGLSSKVEVLNDNSSNLDKVVSYIKSLREGGSR